MSEEAWFQETVSVPPGNFWSLKGCYFGHLTCSLFSGGWVFLQTQLYSLPICLLGKSSLWRSFFRMLRAWSVKKCNYIPECWSAKKLKCKVATIRGGKTENIHTAALFKSGQNAVNQEKKNPFPSVFLKRGSMYVLMRFSGQPLDYLPISLAHGLTAFIAWASIDITETKKH